MAINLAWTANSAGDSVTGYSLYWGTATGNYNGGTSPISVGNTVAYAFSGNTGRVYFALTATNASGESAKSSEVFSNSAWLGLIGNQ